MAIPVANFTYNIQGVTVDFTDLSINNATSWSWDFGGDGVSSDQHPQHIFTAEGTYDVTLIASNIDGSSAPFIRTVRVRVPTTLFIDDFLNADLPEGLSIDPTSKDVWIQKWQEWLHILIDPHIPTPDINNETAWPNLMNALIAKLVIHDAYTRAAEGAIVLSMQQATGSQETTSPDSAPQEKLIETGPTKVEWHDAASTIKAMMKIGAGEEDKSIFDLMRQQICRLASRQRVTLPMCPPLAHSPVVPIKAGRVCPSDQDILRDYRFKM